MNFGSYFGPIAQGAMQGQEFYQQQQAAQQLAAARAQEQQIRDMQIQQAKIDLKDQEIIAKLPATSGFANWFENLKNSASQPDQSAIQLPAQQPVQGVGQTSVRMVQPQQQSQQQPAPMGAPQGGGQAYPQGMNQMPNYQGGMPVGQQAPMGSGGNMGAPAMPPPNLGAPVATQWPLYQATPNAGGAVGATPFGAMNAELPSKDQYRQAAPARQPEPDMYDPRVFNKYLGQREAELQGMGLSPKAVRAQLAAEQAQFKNDIAENKTAASEKMKLAELAVKFDPKSLSKFVKSGDPSDLVPIEKEKLDPLIENTREISRLQKIAENPATPPAVRRDAEQQMARIDANMPSNLRAQTNVYVQQRDAAKNNVSSIIPDKDQGKSGEEFLKTLTPSRAKEVKAFAEGRLPISAASLRNPKMMPMIEQAIAYDPTFDAGLYAARQSTRRDFTSGASAKNVTALNTAIGHMGTLNALAEAADKGDVQFMNKLVSAAQTEFGKPQVTNTELASIAVGDEMMRVFRQVGASETEAEAWRNKFNAAVKSPAQMKGAITTAVDLLGSRIDALNDQWNRGMNTDKGYPDLLSKKSVATIEKLGGKIPEGLRGARASDTSGGAPKGGLTFSSKDELSAAIKSGKIKKGDTFNDPDGNPHVVQ